MSHTAASHLTRARAPNSNPGVARAHHARPHTHRAFQREVALPHRRQPKRFVGEHEPPAYAAVAAAERDIELWRARAALHRALWEEWRAAPLTRAACALARRRSALGNNVTFDLGELVEEDPAEAHDDPESFRSLDLDLDPEESGEPFQVEV